MAQREIQVDQIVDTMNADNALTAIFAGRIYFGKPVSDQQSGVYLIFNIITKPIVEESYSMVRLEARFTAKDADTKTKDLIDAKNAVSNYLEQKAYTVRLQRSKSLNEEISTMGQMKKVERYSCKTISFILQTTKMKKDTAKKPAKKNIEKLDEIVAEKHAQEEKNNEKPIENGTGILIMLSGDILMGGLLFKKGIAYKVNKQQFVDLEKHTRILGVAMQIL